MEQGGISAEQRKLLEHLHELEIRRRLPVSQAELEAYAAPLAPAAIGTGIEALAARRLVHRDSRGELRLTAAGVRLLRPGAPPLLEKLSWIFGIAGAVASIYVLLPGPPATSPPAPQGAPPSDRGADPPPSPDLRTPVNRLPQPEPDPQAPVVSPPPAPVPRPVEPKEYVLAADQPILVHSLRFELKIFDSWGRTWGEVHIWDPEHSREYKANFDHPESAPRIVTPDGGFQVVLGRFDLARRRGSFNLLKV